jgi:hypothetical protein
MQELAVARREVLHEPASVGVAVEVDLLEPDGLDDRREVVDRVGRREQRVRAAAEAPVDRPRARGGAPREGRPAGAAGETLHARAIDERAGARPAVVDEQQVPAQRPERPAVLDPRAGRRIPRPALDGDDRRPVRRPAVPAEGDVDRPPVAERALHCPADRAAAAVQADRVGGRGEPQPAHHDQDGEAPHTR